MRKREGDIANGLAVTPKVGRLTVDQLLAGVTDDYAVNELGSIGDLGGRIKNHLLPFFSGWRAAVVRTDDIKRYTRERLEAGAANATVNRELAVLKRGFSLALESGTLFAKPHIPMLAENNVRTGFFERDQFESVRKHLPEELQPVVTFAYITGWRTNSEILTLEWSQVDFKAGTVRLNPGTTKNKEGRLFPFKTDPELTSVLEAQRAKRDALQKDKGMICPWVFHRAGRPIKDYRKAWATASEAAGVPGRIPHDFRRTAVRNLERAGVSRSAAMKLTGHKMEAVYRRYAIVSETDLSEAVAKLQSLKAEGVAGTVLGTVAHERVQNAREVSA